MERQQKPRFAALVLIAVLLVPLRALALDTPNSFNFEGVLTDSSNVPYTGSQSVTFSIYNPAGDCLLYEETQTVTADTTGAFAAKVGGGSRVSAGADGGLPWKSVFANNGQLRASSSTNCTPGYTPANGDGRALRVKVGAQTLTPDFQLASTPFATVATSLQGYMPTDFVNIAGGSIITGITKIDNTSLRFSGGSSGYVGFAAPAGLSTYTSYTLPATDGSNGQVLTTNGGGILSWSAGGGGAGLATTGGSMTGNIAMNGNSLTNVGALQMNGGTFIKMGSMTNTTQSSSIAGFSAADAGKVWYNSDMGSLYYYNGSSAQAVGGGGSGITAVYAGTGMTGGGVTGGVTLSADVGTTANKIVQLDGSARLPAVDGSLLTNLTAAKVLSGAGLTNQPAITFAGDTQTGLFSPGAGSLAISTAGSERLRIINSGLIGVGTASPAAMVHILAPAATTALHLTSSTTSLDTKYQAGGSIAVYKYSSSGNKFSWLINGAAFPQAVLSEGTSFPVLELLQDGGTQPPLSLKQFSSGGSGALMDSVAGRGSASSPTGVQSGDTLLAIAARGYMSNNAASTTPSASINLMADETITTTAKGGRIQFDTVTTGGTTPATRMAITSGGNIGIGTTTPAVGLDVQSTFRVGSAITGGGYISNMRLCAGTSSPTAVSDTAGANFSITCTGAAAGSIVYCSPDTAQAATISWSAAVVTAGTITVYGTNSNTTGGFTSANWKCVVMN